jgi:hypothetical protein
MTPKPPKQHVRDVKKNEAPLQPLGPYNRDADSGDNPDVDDITAGDEAQKRRETMNRHRQAKAEG